MCLDRSFHLAQKYKNWFYNNTIDIPSIIKLMKIWWSIIFKLAASISPSISMKLKKKKNNFYLFRTFWFNNEITKYLTMNLTHGLIGLELVMEISQLAIEYQSIQSSIQLSLNWLKFCYYLAKWKRNIKEILCYINWFLV